MKLAHNKTLRSTAAALLTAALVGSVLAGCTKSPASGASPSAPSVSASSSPAASPSPSAKPAVQTPLAVYKPEQKSMGVFYEIFVRSFYDTNGDGIGDLKGVTEKLDYLKELGAEGIWLMPINPSPSYHGYDVTDYYNVNPQYGTVEDLRKLTQEAHKRGIKVIMDLVVNHSSAKHPWFIDSAKGKDSKYRSWYKWAEATGQDTGKQGAFNNKAWHEKNGTHYLGVFWDQMPDFNMDHPEVRKEMVKIGNFWLQQGIDGFRLDAAKHVYEDLAGDKAKPETAQKNQAWWQEFRKGLTVKPDVYLIGEVWDSASVVAPYLNEAFQSAFNFDASKMLIDSVRSERPSALARTLIRNYEVFGKSSQGKFLDAPFLTNHDQNRVMSELRGKPEHAKMAAAILLTLPGNPFIYYGEEIGMMGAKPDEYIREPMLWYADGKAGPGQTKWEASRYNKERAPSVEAQLKDPESLLNHYKKMIDWHKNEPALRNGGIGEYRTDNNSVMAFVRMTDKETVLVIHNVTGKEQAVKLDEAGPQFGKLAHATKDGARLDGGQLTMPAYSTVILK